MSAKILDGKKLASSLEKRLTKEVAALKQSSGHVPTIVNIMFGEDHGACAYANSQKKVAEQISLNYQLKTLATDITQDKFVSCIEELNNDSRVNGIMIHRPVPSHIDYYSAANRVDIQKDLEGINVANIGRMLLGETDIVPCTPASIMEHIYSTGIDLRGKEAVMVGHSDIVGKPLSLLLLRQLATVTVCHIGTSEAGRLEEHVSRADILVVAVGRARLVKGSWIKEGAVVIDVGINKTESGVEGDVEFQTAKERASYITPVPGGVGPVTVVMLMKNGIEAFKLQNKLK